MKTQNDVNKYLYDDGQRAFRLKKGICDCPDFESKKDRDDWNLGFRDALRRKNYNELK